YTTNCTAASVRQCRCEDSRISARISREYGNTTATAAPQSRSNPVSGRCLPKTGIFQMSAGDYRLIRAGSGQIRSLETGRQFAKARHWRAFLAFPEVKSLWAG